MIRGSAGCFGIDPTKPNSAATTIAEHVGYSGRTISACLQSVRAA